MIEAAFGTATMALARGADRRAARRRATRRRAIRVAAITRDADRKEAIAAATDFLAKRRVHDVGAAARFDWTRRPGPTLSDPQLTKPLFGLLHPVHVSRPTDKQQPGEDLLDERADLRKRQPWSLARAHRRSRLEKRVGDRADHHVMLPARIRAAFEVIEAEFGS